MKTRFTLLFFFIFACTWNIFTQNPNRIFQDYQEHENTLEVSTNEGKYIFKPYSNKIMETSFIPIGESFDPHSHAVVMVPEKQRTKVANRASILEYSTSGISVRIKKSPFQIQYYYNDSLLISEKEGYSKKEEYETITFNLTPGEVLYGGGTRVLGTNRRGNRLELYNRAHYGYTTHSELMNYTIPIVVSSSLYMIHFDNAPIGFLDLDSNNDSTLAYETISGRMTYQVITGDTWPDMLDQYTDLTGKQPLPPRWAFGNFSSRFGYHSEKEVRETVNMFFQDSIPLDAVVIDIYWFGPEIKGSMGNLEFLADSFPTPYKMMEDFAEKGVKTILVTEPFILTTSDRWEEAVEEEILGTDSLGNPYTYDFYFGNTGLIDIFKPGAKEWFWDIYKYYTEKGVGGWWGDLGEPEVHPSDLQHVVGSADEVHNIYGHEWTKLIYEGYQKDFPDKRPFILMRAGYSGTQRYGIIPWTGDVLRDWGGLQPQTDLSLQMGLQGIAYMHSDLGGFAEGKVFDPELYTRWLQYGVFQPVYRPHAQEHIPAEPVFHDEETKALARESIKLRYSLIPYIYTMAFQNSISGIPLMRPLFFEEPENKELYEVSETYLWGDDFLVSPVVRPGVRKQNVYFPKGSTWYDFYSGKKYEGGRFDSVSVVPEHIPVFVRGGAFIPMVKPVQTTKDYSTKELILNYYYDPEVPESKRIMYDDDGISPDAFAEGKYEIVKFKSQHGEDLLNIQISSRAVENYTSQDRNIELYIRNFDKKIQEVFINDNPVIYFYDKSDKSLRVPFTMEGSNTKTVSVKWK